MSQQQPSPEELATWQRRIASRANNKAWELSEKLNRTEAEDQRRCCMPRMLPCICGLSSVTRVTRLMPNNCWPMSMHYLATQHTLQSISKAQAHFLLLDSARHGRSLCVAQSQPTLRAARATLGAISRSIMTQHR